MELDAQFEDVLFQVAYAFCYIHADRRQKVSFLFGSADDAKVWINGTLVHRHYGGRAVMPGQDEFDAEIRKGYNRVLIKVANRVREWGFSDQTPQTRPSTNLGFRSICPCRSTLG